MGPCKHMSSLQPTRKQQQLEPAEIIGEDCRFLGFQVSATTLRFLHEFEVTGRRTTPFDHDRPVGAVRPHVLLPVSMFRLKSSIESHLQRRIKTSL